MSELLEVNQTNEIPFLNIADKNCWIVYLLPFSSGEKSNYNLVSKFQNHCIEKKTFGMGWSVPGIEAGTPISYTLFKKQNELFKKEYNVAEDISQKAFESYTEIRKGDYVVIRNKNGHYYVGKVSSDRATYLSNGDDPELARLSWGCEVEEWIDFPQERLVPSEIVGRFSQALHSTIERIADYRQKLLVIAMYENNIDTSRKDKTLPLIPKVRICEKNLAESLNYKELEDLVALYIYGKHKADGYFLLPSSCKINEPLYEYVFIAPNRKPITCQVKNQAIVDIDVYKNETSYEMIYIFSGKWNDKNVDELNEKYRDYPHICIIKPSDLFSAVHNSVFTNEYYDFSHPIIRPEEILPLEGYNEKGRSCTKEHDCRISKNSLFLYFWKDNGLFYSAEFNALILSHHIDKSENEYKRSMEIKKDLSNRIKKLEKCVY